MSVCTGQMARLTLGTRAAGTGPLRLLENSEFIMETTTIARQPGKAHDIAHSRGIARIIQEVRHSDSDDAQYLSPWASTASARKVGTVIVAMAMHRATRIPTVRNRRADAARSVYNMHMGTKIADIKWLMGLRKGRKDRKFGMKNKGTTEHDSESGSTSRSTSTNRSSRTRARTRSRTRRQKQQEQEQPRRKVEQSAYIGLGLKATRGQRGAQTERAEMEETLLSEASETVLNNSCRSKGTAQAHVYVCKEPGVVAG